MRHSVDSAALLQAACQSVYGVPLPEIVWYIDEATNRVRFFALQRVRTSWTYSILNEALLKFDIIHNKPKIRPFIIYMIKLTFYNWIGNGVNLFSEQIFGTNIRCIQNYYSVFQCQEMEILLLPKIKRLIVKIHKNNNLDKCTRRLYLEQRELPRGLRHVFHLPRHRRTHVS